MNKISPDQHLELPADPHAMAGNAVLDCLASCAGTGLSHRQAARRLALFGPNALKTRKPVGTFRLVANQLESPVVALLAAAALLAFLFGEWKEAAAIVVVLVINTIIGFVTELRAVRSMEALRQLAATVTRVRRDGHIVEVAAEALVPGDIVILEGGDLVTADLRLIEANNLSADESTLTGESLAVDKQPEPVSLAAPLAERNCMAFKGTAITRGSGLGIVVATGMGSELGKITRLVEEARPEQSPLERKLERLSGQLIGFTIITVALIGIVGVATGRDLLLMVEAAIALAVAAIPEGLPIVATMALARGMWRMARHNAVIERLAAVETLGGTTVIFSDKTGTLTENRMVVSTVWLPAGKLDMEAVARVGSAPPLDALLTAIVLCNKAELPDRDGGGTGDPMELALLRAGRKAGKKRAHLLRALPQMREVPFDTDSKMMATVHRTEEGAVVFVKGAPEAVLAACRFVAGATMPVKLARHEVAHWHDRTQELAAQGMRVLAVATKAVASPQADAYRDLQLLGLIGLRDPPRADVAGAIEDCRQAGIRVVMMTGDHAATARAIAAAIGLYGNTATVIEGNALRQATAMSARERRQVLEADIFARVTPAQKLDIITIHQKNGAIVAMTGDGVNDAPALKKADIGIAMGLRGTQVAREAAAMVLRDDAFATIVNAIREGRVIFRNIQNFVTYLLSCNLAEILTVGLGVVAGLPLPLLPLQILLLNLVTDVFPAFALGAGEGDDEILNRPPRRPGRPIMTRALWWEVAGHGFSITAATLAALLVAHEWLGLEGEAAVTISFLTLALAQLWHVFNMRDPRAPVFANAITRNRYVWMAIALCSGLLLLLVHVPLTADLLQLHSPDARGWLVVVGMSLVPLLLGQSGKQVYRWLCMRNHRNGPQPVSLRTSRINQS